MEKYLTESDKKCQDDRRKQELLVLKSELSSLKPDRKIYVERLGDHSSAGRVFFKSNNSSRLKSDVEQALQKLN